MIEQVLREAREPLHYREITRRILAQGLWATKGLTPRASVNARLAVDIKRNPTNSQFRRTANGVYALRDLGAPRVAEGKRSRKTCSRLD